MNSFFKKMNRSSNNDLLSTIAIAGIGAGTVTSFAVSQGQSPWMALLITAIATTFTVICHRAGLV
ncbi:MAG: hypothetical protein BRC33_11985 [Cyanobacteria bacterium SW_9_44_58]|nr:MAG: hypothetical protein BRC33_11985 [Cyanobacteria bacterium SW_9_44_58]